MLIEELWISAGYGDRRRDDLSLWIRVCGFDACGACGEEKI